MTDLAGQQFGEYRIISEIGHGGFATVYLALDLRRRTYVAVKILHAYIAFDAEYVERFRREAHMARRLDSPHTVKVLDYGRFDDQYYLVMEYVHGKTLARVLRERRVLPLTEALDITRQILRALDAAHRAGIVHRDIKPQNILVTPEGQVKVMDFGVAKARFHGTITQTGAFLGTPQYVSPEQARGERIDIRSDIYSVGIILYEMLTGQVPFTGDTPWAIMQRQMDTPPRPPRRLNRSLPPWIEGVLMKALAKSPSQRFQRPRDMLAALESAVLPPPPERRARPWKQSDRAQAQETRGRVLLVAAGAALVFVTFLAILTNRSPSPLVTPSPAPGATSPVVFRTVVPTPTRTRTPVSTVTRTPSPTVPTLTPTPVPPSPTPTRTPRPPTPTRTKQPSTPTPRPPTPTQTPRPPTSTPRPPTPTRRPPTSTPRPPTITPTPGIKYAAPKLLEPPHEIVLCGGSVELKWAWDGTLGPDEHFDVRIWLGGQSHYGIAWTKEKVYNISGYLSDRGSGTYHWSIAVIRGRNGKWEADLSPESAERAINWCG